MVDLSQDQPLKQKPTPDAPAGDQPPVTQPIAPSKQLDDISSPQITTEEKIATPEQEEIKKELSELGIPPEGGSKKTRVLLAALGVLLLIATLPAAVYLVQQRQEIRKEAVGEPCSHPGGYIFPDVPPGSTYFKAVDCLTGLPYCCIAGYPDGTFKPYQAITRAEAVTFITRYHIHVRGDWQWYTPTGPSFPDVPTNYWAFLFIETAKHYGFITGYPDGTFRPDSPWLYGFHGINQNEYDFTQEGSTINRGDFIQGLYDYGMGRGELPECAPTTPTPTPTPIPTEVLTCIDLAGTPDPSGLSKGDKITLTCKGTSKPEPMNHFEFRVSVDSGTPTSLPNAPATKTDSEYKGEIKYTVPDYGCYKIECRACTSIDSSKCTQWGRAQ